MGAKRERDGPELRVCRECNLPHAKAEMLRCDLCRKWFCQPCMRDCHWFTCSEVKGRTVKR